MLIQDLIRANKRNSFLLIIVIAILLLVVGYAIGAAYGFGIGGLGIAGIIVIVMSLVSYFSGGKIILSISKAKEIEKKDNPQLWNVVEEMCIAGGVPLPRIYIIDDSAPNAFATGRNPENGVVAITTGLLEKLNRDELQGVMAHEISHIRNYDILFSMMIGIMVGCIAMFCDIFLRSVFWGGHGRRRRNNREGGGGAQAIMMVLALLLAIFAPIFAKALQLAVSRQREYLADASAVELTRYPEGLANALKKISGDQEVLEVANRATQHLYIINPIKSFEKRASSMFSTHPSVDERVNRLMSIGGK